MDLETAQLNLETTSVTRGVERYMETLRKDVEKGREFDTSVGQKVVSQIIERLRRPVLDLQKDARKKLVDAQTSGRRLQGWEMAIAISDPLKLAYIAARTLLNNPFVKKHVLMKSIGTVVNLELRWEELRNAERERAKDDPPNRVEILRRTAKKINPRSLRVWLRRLDDISTTEWDNETKVKVGMVVVDLIRTHCDDIVNVQISKAVTKGRAKTICIISLADHIRKKMQAEHAQCAESQPWLLPMVHTPRLWKWDGEKYVGGYLSMDLPLIGTRGHSHTKLILDGNTVPEDCLESLNAISQTPWQINEAVFEVAAAALEREVVDVLPVEPYIDIPELMDADEWAKMSSSERGAVRSQRRRIHDKNNKNEAKREAMFRVLNVAESFLDVPAFYFPHMLDFRGRAYPLPQDLQPQAYDFARGLLQFADAKPLGKGGLSWLSYRAAATYGEDKATRTQQLDWVIGHLNDISAVASDPYGAGFEFWKQAEEPWQFLALCIELERAFKHPEGPAAYPSRVPVFVDGSCNGLQHLSAMGLDPDGAFATNLTPCPERQDIYQIVADKVVEQLADAEEDAADAWRGRVTRKVVKRGVMTVPYGLTDIGMRDQLIQDGWTDDLDGDPRANATYLRDLMKEAVDETVVAASEIMDWLQGNAHILAHNNKPVDWTTPSGMRVRQAYYNMTRTRVNTLLGATFIEKEHEDNGLNIRKQVLSIVPNIIHSFDAAHMMLTIKRAYDEGLRYFAVVHDSYGCHACDMDSLLVIVRNTFADIYETDWFASLQSEMQETVGAETPLLKPPERGGFSPDEMRDAPFLFA